MTTQTHEKRQAAWILALAWLAYSAAVMGVASASYQANQRHLGYALDDAYIHMAIAKNVVLHGTFGITPHEFSSASSSPLWTGLLAGAYFVWGVSEWPPLVLNSLFGLAALFVIWSFGFRVGLRGLRLGLLLATTILLTPMVPLTFTGMEHLLHLFAVVLLIRFLWEPLSTDRSIGRAALLGLAVSAALAVAARYESLFLVAAASIALGVKRRWTAMVICTLGALLPVCAFGVFSLANGQHFVPNSLLLKGNLPELTTVVGIVKLLGYDAMKKLESCPHLCSLLACLIALFLWRRFRGHSLDGANWLALVVGIATGLHLQFARIGWFYRYEAYLVALAITLIFSQIQQIVANQEAFRLRSRALVPVVVVLILFLLPLASRAVSAHSQTIRATQNQ